MPAWLERQRAEQRRKSRDRALTVGAGLAGAAGYEGYALARKPSWSVTRNARVSSQAAQRSRDLAGRGAQESANARSMTAPARHTAERRAWERGRALQANPGELRWKHGFDPKRFTSGGTGMKSQAYAQQVGLGSVRANFGLSRRAAERVMGVGRAGQAGPFAYVPKAGSAPPKGTPAYDRWKALTDADAAQRAKNVAMRQNMVATAQRRHAKQQKARGAAMETGALRQAREKTARRGASMLNRSRGLEATSRYAAKQGFKGGARMGLAFAGASGTTAAGLAGMRAWQRRNAKKASALPRPSWERLNDTERQKAIGFGATRRPVGAIGTPGRRGTYS